MEEKLKLDDLVSKTNHKINKYNDYVKYPFRIDEVGYNFQLKHYFCENVFII